MPFQYHCVVSKDGSKFALICVDNRYDRGPITLPIPFNAFQKVLKLSSKDLEGFGSEQLFDHYLGHLLGKVPSRNTYLNRFSFSL